MPFSASGLCLPLGTKCRFYSTCAHSIMSYEKVTWAVIEKGAIRQKINLCKDVYDSSVSKELGSKVKSNNR